VGLRLATLGRAYFRGGRFAAAAAEFEAVVDTHQVNDFAHFCLGRALAKTGDEERGLRPREEQIAYRRFATFACRTASLPR